MFFKLMILLSLIISLVMGLIPNPFILCMMVLLLTGGSCGLVSLLSSLWLSYALVIVFLGGMMVLFTYASSMSVSDKFMKKADFSLGGLLLVVMMFSSLPAMSGLTMSSFYSGVGVFMLSLSTVYLLICLFLVVKMVEVSEGALIS